MHDRRKAKIDMAQGSKFSNILFQNNNCRTFNHHNSLKKMGLSV